MTSTFNAGFRRRDRTRRGLEAEIEARKAAMEKPPEPLDEYPGSGERNHELAKRVLPERPDGRT